MPTVSCVMVTRNRRFFADQAIRYFLRQDYPARELIIMDDGDDSINDLVPDDARLRYVHLDTHLSIGEKRNRACAMSQGALIAHWDDDDWMAPDRLRTQITHLQSVGAGICGASTLRYYHPVAARAWRYAPPTSTSPWLAGGTLL